MYRFTHSSNVQISANPGHSSPKCGHFRPPKPMHCRNNDNDGYKFFGPLSKYCCITRTDSTVKGTKVGMNCGTSTHPPNHSNWNNGNNVLISSGGTSYSVHFPGYMMILHAFPPNSSSNACWNCEREKNNTLLLTFKPTYHFALLSNHC